MTVIPKALAVIAALVLCMAAKPAAATSLPIEAIVYYTQTSSSSPSICTSTAAYDSSQSGGTQLVALASGQGIYLCGYTLFGANGGMAQLVYGTGTNCETGRTALTPAYQLASQTPIVDGGDTVHGISVPSGNALCIVTNYKYYQAITINYTKVATTNNTNQTDFPVLVSGTYANLATAAHGGYVQNASGYDIMFSSDSAGADPLPYEVESYSASTGAVNFWVQVPTVSASANTVIYMWYDNPDISTTQSNATGTWDSNYQAVWHMADNAASTTIVDSTTQNNGTMVSGNTSSYTTTGPFYQALSFDTNNATMNSYFSYTNNFTIEGWFNFVSTPYGIYSNMNSSNQSGYVLACCSNGMYVYNGNHVDDGNNPPSGTWEHIVVNCISNTLAIYVNGVSQVSTSSCASASTGVFTINTFWTNHLADGYNSDMSVAELRISSTGRSADWIVTSYNNQNSPSTFYSVGSQQQP